MAPCRAALALAQFRAVPATEHGVVGMKWGAICERSVDLNGQSGGKRTSSPEKRASCMPRTVIAKWHTTCGGVFQRRSKFPRAGLDRMKRSVSEPQTSGWQRSLYAPAFLQASIALTLAGSMLSAIAGCRGFKIAMRPLLANTP
jgi:hypothetical protein